MGKQVVKLPNGKCVSLREYVHAWRTLKLLPDDYPVTNFDYFPVTVAEALREIRHGCQDRINRHMPQQTGRKHTEQWQHSVRRLAWLLGANVYGVRCVIRLGDVHPDLWDKLRHRITWPGEL